MRPKVLSLLRCLCLCLCFCLVLALSCLDQDCVSLSPKFAMFVLQNGRMSGINLYVSSIPPAFAFPPSATHAAVSQPLTSRSASPLPLPALLSSSSLLLSPCNTHTFRRNSRVHLFLITRLHVLISPECEGTTHEDGGVETDS
jgi:hypothetical protein